MNRDVSILKARNFVQKVGGKANVDEIRAQYLIGHPAKRIAEAWGMTESQFSDYFNNYFCLVPIERTEILEDEKWQEQIQQSRPVDDRIRTATNVLRLLQSGDKKLQEETA